MSKKKRFYKTQCVHVEKDIFDLVVAHTDKSGGKIGKFFSIAGKEKMEREGLLLPDQKSVGNYGK